MEKALNTCALNICVLNTSALNGTQRDIYPIWDDKTVWDNYTEWVT